MFASIKYRPITMSRLAIPESSDSCDCRAAQRRRVVRFGELFRLQERRGWVETGQSLNVERTAGCWPRALRTCHSPVSAKHRRLSHPVKGPLWLKAVWMSQVSYLFSLLAPTTQVASLWLGHVGDAIHGVAALRALFVRADLADPLEDINFDSLLGEAGEEAADGMRRPTHGLGDLRSACAPVAAQHGENLRLLSVRPRMRATD
jgi:hypothetical protein